MLKTATTIGPADKNRRMSLAEFDHVEVKEGYRYELSRGVIIVSEIPSPWHLAQVNELGLQLSRYREEHDSIIHAVGHAGECKFLINSFESERQPDLAIYRWPPPRSGNVWADWIPDIVLEVVEPGSEERDYVLKREEYLDFGVREYWIVDADRREVLVLRRRGQQWSERVLRAKEKYPTKSLPGFELDVAAIFRAADRAQ
jgi:Uma2 family endonuclease